MKVSIVIPVYNTEKYLRECIESCVNQTHEDKEIIIVDDGSTDNSSKIIMEYFHKYPVLIHPVSKNNGGTASALNVGIDNMQGEWFKWVSADDVLLPTAIEDMLKSVTDIDMLYYTDYDIIDEDSNVMSSFKDKEYYWQKAELYHNFFGNGSTSLIHRTMFNVIGKFREGMPYNEDYEFWMRWVLKYNFQMVYLPITTLRYRVHNNSLTCTKNSTDNKVSVEKLRLEYYKYLTDADKKHLKTLRAPLKRRIGRKFPILVRLFK